MSEHVEHGLIVSFTDNSEAFTNGFEAGMLWQRMEAGEQHIAAVVHCENQEVILRLADHHELLAAFAPCEVEGWVNCEIRPMTKRPFLTVIPGGLVERTAAHARIGEDA